jgi:probable HAF family extracellular repeat protein
MESIREATLWGITLTAAAIRIAFCFSNGTFIVIDPPGTSFFAAALGINPQGDIVGTYFDSSGNSHGFLLSKGTFTDIDVPGSLGASPGTTTASGINPQGAIVGYYFGSGFNIHGFLLSK